jgi:transposase
VDVRITSTTVEVLYKNRRVASHIRSYREGAATTNPDHMPKSHRRYLEWTPSRIISWAARTGPATAELVEKVLLSKPHPEMGFRSCLGIIRLGREFGPERLEAASERAVRMNAFSYKSVKSILQNGLDRIAANENQSQLALPVHANIRGRDYYGNRKENKDQCF